MFGQGSPHSSNRVVLQSPIQGHALRWSALSVWLLVTLFCATLPAADQDPLDLRLQISWGGSTSSRQWQGTVSLLDGTFDAVAPLGFDADQNRTLLWQGNRITVRQSRPRRYDGAEVRVRAHRTGTLRIQLAPLGEPSSGKTLEVPLSQLVEEDFFEQLDDQRNSIFVTRVAGDRLRLKSLRDALVFAPGEEWELEFEPHEFRAPAVALRAELKLVRQSNGETVWTDQQALRADAAGQLPAIGPISLTLPSEEGVYNLQLTLNRRRPTAPFTSTPLPTTPFTGHKPILERTVQLVVVGGERQTTGSDATNTSGELVMEIDPANPSWWDRMPKLPTPAAMRRWLPGNRETPLASSGVTTRQMGGHKWVALPPGGWQAFPLPLEQSGQPYEVTIDYPAGGPQRLAITWLDPDAAGELAPGNLDTGLVVEPAAGIVTAGMATQVDSHRLLVWPQAEGAILLLVNRSERQPGYFGTIRVR